MVKGSTEPIGLAMQRSVKQLHFGRWQEKEAAAVDITRMAKEGRGWRKSLAGLGVIPCLVSMLDSDDGRRLSLAVRALLELANGTYSNKALMVEAGVLVKLKIMMATKDQSRRREVLALLLSLSSLDKTHFCNFTSAEVLLPILADTLTASATTDDVKLITLTILCNLSAKLENIKAIVSNKLVSPLLNLLVEPSPTPASVMERALMTLGNVVVTTAGRREVEDMPTIVPECFVNIMKLDDRPRCQELATYVLMVLGHDSATQRQKMANAGVVPALLGVALLGSELGRRRAMKLLEWFKGEGMVRVHSGPQEGSGAVVEMEGCVGKAKEHRKDMQKMVKQSLHKNMEVILRRAGASRGNGPASLMRLIGSSSSKTLPF